MPHIRVTINVVVGRCCAHKSRIRRNRVIYPDICCVASARILEHDRVGYLIAGIGRGYISCLRDIQDGCCDCNICTIRELRIRVTIRVIVVECGRVVQKCSIVHADIHCDCNRDSSAGVGSHGSDVPRVCVSAHVVVGWVGTHEGHIGWNRVLHDD